MEFISLKDSSEDIKKTINPKFKRKQKIDGTTKEGIDEKIKPRTGVKVLNKKNVKNKYKEVLALKQKNKVLKKKNKKQQEVDSVEVDENVQVDKRQNEKEKVKFKNEGENKNGNEDEDEDADVNEDESEDENEDEEESENEEEVFKRKCREMDEKKKNRLFLKFKKKIYSEGQIKELHPNIRSVIFPRKKKSRWCWALFASAEKANETLKQLSKNKDIFVSKPNPYDRVDKKRKEKMKTVLRKKKAEKKLQEMWV